MGGSVGLKGTDGDMYARAVQLGAEPVSPQRTRDFLQHVDCLDQIRLLVGPGTMGTAAGGSGDSKNVVAKRVPTLDGTREVGAYAYWVGDLGIKANVGQVDRYQDNDPARGGRGRAGRGRGRSAADRAVLGR